MEFDFLPAWDKGLLVYWIYPLNLAELSIAPSHLEIAASFQGKFAFSLDEHVFGYAVLDFFLPYYVIGWNKQLRVKRGQEPAKEHTEEYLTGADYRDLQEFYYDYWGENFFSYANVNRVLENIGDFRNQLERGISVQSAKNEKELDMLHELMSFYKVVVKEDDVFYCRDGRLLKFYTQFIDICGT